MDVDEEEEEEEDNESQFVLHSTNRATDLRKSFNENAPNLGNIKTLEDMRGEIILDIGKMFKSREAALRACCAYCEANCSSHTMLRADWNRIEAVCSETRCAFKCTISSRIQPSSYMWVVSVFAPHDESCEKQRENYPRTEIVDVVLGLGKLLR